MNQPLHFSIVQIILPIVQIWHAHCKALHVLRMLRGARQPTLLLSEMVRRRRTLTEKASRCAPTNDVEVEPCRPTAVKFQRLS
jgi:hypothetical protein